MKQSGEDQIPDSASGTRRDCRERGAAGAPGLRNPQPSLKRPAGQGQGQFCKMSLRLYTHTHTHTQWPPWHQSSHRNTQPSHTHTPHNAATQKVTEHAIQVTVTHAAPHCDMTHRHISSDTTFTPTKYTGSQTSQGTDKPAKRRLTASQGNTGAATQAPPPGHKGAPNSASATPRTCTQEMFKK